jgi:hypothetical protein
VKLAINLFLSFTGSGLISTLFAHKGSFAGGMKLGRASGTDG